MWSLAGPKGWTWMNEQSRWFWAQGQTGKQRVYTCLTLLLSAARVRSGWSVPILYWLLPKYSEYHSF